jgi:hypothetical protein
MAMRSGRLEAVPYSLSRWTDVPAAKWEWFKSQLLAGQMQAFDPRTAVPEWWALTPEETHSLVFWTKDPRNLVRDFDLIKPYRTKLHVTITGWEEVVHGAPTPEVAAQNASLISNLIGKANVTWRFSPVPLLPAHWTSTTPSEKDGWFSMAGLALYDRFERIAGMLRGVTETVYLSFLQTNDLMPETRVYSERARIAAMLTMIGTRYGLRVLLCNDDTSLGGTAMRAYGITTGVCVPCEGDPRGGPVPVSEKCGCAIMVDPFTINETCTMGCTYCYAADKSLADKKRNSTKGLRVVK